MEYYGEKTSKRVKDLANWIKNCEDDGFLVAMLLGRNLLDCR